MQHKASIINERQTQFSTLWLDNEKKLTELPDYWDQTSIGLIEIAYSVWDLSPKKAKKKTTQAGPIEDIASLP